jgi:redox-sensitive bicupin YhaK (pirin superfamily)
MRIHRPAGERGRTAIGWLDSRHTFSFADYHDEVWMGFRALRVINDDWVEPGQGFGTHGHRDMEIITWVLDGVLTHRDSTGGGGDLRHGDAQVMTAGSGIRHSEFNGSPTQRSHFLQTWILPDRRNEKPAYGQTSIPAAARDGRWAVIAAGGGRPAALAIAADAAVAVASLAPGQRLAYDLAAGRHAWLHVASGAVEVDGQRMQAGDGLGVSEEAGLAIIANTASEVMLFDLA